MTPTMQEIHENVFQMLYKRHLEDNDFCFTLRQRNRGGRMDNGYWFHGTDTYLAVSCWTGFDNVNNTPNIFFSVNITNNNRIVCYVSFSCQSGERPELADFFEKLAKVKNIGLDRSSARDRKTKRPKFINLWNKEIKTDPDEDYKLALIWFLDMFKPNIDVFLSLNNKDGITPIPNDEAFNSNLKKVLEIRKNQHTIKQISSAPIRLDSLELKNIGHFHHCQLSFNSAVTCLVGANGIGKTSILRAIALGLAGVENTVIDKMDISIQRMLRIEKEDNPVKEEGSIDLYYKMDQPYHNKIVWVDRGEMDSDGFLYTTIINDSESDFNSVYQGVYFRNTLVIGFPQNSYSDENYLKRERQSAKLGTDKPKIYDVDKLIQNLPDNRINQLKEWLDSYVRPGVPITVEEKNKAKSIKSKIIHFLKKVTLDNSLDLEYIGHGENAQLFAYTSQAPQGIPFELLSQGYNNLMGWVSRFMIRMAEVDQVAQSAIVLIDEIDTYLHPQWQRAILPALVEAFPNTQFVLTTHSPYVLGTLAAEQMTVYQIRKSENSMVIRQVSEPNLYGYDLNWLSQDEEIFDTPSRSAQHIYDAIRRHIAAGDGDNLNLAESGINELISKGVSPHEPELLRLQQALKTRKILYSKLK